MSFAFVEHVLPNGLRVVCEVMPRVRSAAVAFLARAGARHEIPGQHGVSHFLEHMSFKGTTRRSSRDINVGFAPFPVERMNPPGGERARARSGTRP